MRVVIRDNAQETALFTATYIRDRINASKPTAERPFVLGLPTGSTPIPVYKKLVEFYQNGLLSFRHVHTFNMDEYVGLPRDHPESYHSFMWNHLFKHIDIHPGHVHILDGNAADLAAECKAYEEAIVAVGGIELFLAGLGSDGHIAFNEPGSSLTSRTRIKTLAYETIIANCRFFDNDITKVPTMALTVGVGTVMDAREVVVIATGVHKADALMKCIEMGVNHMFTMSALQMHPCTMICCDEDATLECRVRTIRYFKGLEKTCAGLPGSLSSSISTALAGPLLTQQASGFVMVRNESIKAAASAMSASTPIFALPPSTTTSSSTLSATSTTTTSSVAPSS